MAKILLLNGPNLNLLGNRNQDVYGSNTLADIERSVSDLLQRHQIQTEAYQSNHEGQLIDRLHKANQKCSGVILNPGAFTHTSVALRDAVEAIDIPVIEVHLSNIHNREPFRHQSYIAPVAAGQIIGLGPTSYLAAAYSLIQIIQKRGES
ncbi:type II 3-dehydroquinate dehydratase [Tenuibacillus multivorans]|uniref:3-dehydroquinate dehydratase n=1 Tax=Tenuibacillus multivorans TaxID=237069 RepID=A0A1G9ZA97_9BACI|nr:type II 3-dehydroquinate dehydratase [Tenuibacillus multivorans]GEL77357.1 3-dehydroquinate dehydratase [Tenuibacillus multivorans]SDN17556.1 3-dehydroquinate dehydratase [Tenuibacillus multivorans]